MTKRMAAQQRTEICQRWTTRKQVWRYIVCYLPRLVTLNSNFPGTRQNSKKATTKHIVRKEDGELHRFDLTASFHHNTRVLVEKLINSYGNPVNKKTFDYANFQIFCHCMQEIEMNQMKWLPYIHM